MHFLTGIAFILGALIFGIATPTWAQTAPDAGQVLEESAKPVEPPQSPPSIQIEDTVEPAAIEPGGPQVTLHSVEFSGVSRFDKTTLEKALGDYRGKSYDFAGLTELADHITGFYQDQGYPFVKAYLPPQDISEGHLLIEIIEGRYGDVRVSGDTALKDGALEFLSPLAPGEVIESGKLTHTVLILGDQPGLKIYPVLMPGEKVGSGDLEVEVEKTSRITGYIGVDNHGNRHSGDWRAQTQININRLVRFGDQLTLGAMLTDEELWYGRLGYSLPIGSSGLRGQASIARTQYDLGGDFDDLDATGTADVLSLGISYPLLRTLTTNLRLQATYQYKDLEDKDNTPVPTRSKSSNSVPISLFFDHRDTLAGGGVTWGMLSWTPGRLSLDNDLKSKDRQTAETNGEFHKINLEAARIQRLAGPFTLFGRFSGQWADDNLDSSEGFSLGGADGVRAYPQGEAFGDDGWITQVEIRYDLGMFTPYGFYDSGRIKYNASPWDGGDNRRSLSGGGAGLRIDTVHWAFDANLAWRAWGGRPQTDKRGDHPRIWVSTHYKF